MRPPGFHLETRQESTMTEKNGAETKLARRPFKKGEKERHCLLFSKHSVLLMQAQANVKKLKDKCKLLLEDIDKNGYCEEAQGELGIDVDDDGDRDEARVS
jgi:hypothetical protein